MFPPDLGAAKDGHLYVAAEPTERVAFEREILEF